MKPLFREHRTMDKDMEYVPEIKDMHPIQVRATRFRYFAGMLFYKYTYTENYNFKQHDDNRVQGLIEKKKA